MFGSENIDEFDVVNSVTCKIAQQVQETEEEFIFKTLSDYVANNYNIVVEKQELIRAIQLVRMYKEHGFLIDERWETATEQSARLRKEYKRGFRDGINKEHDRIMGILEDVK